MKSTLMLLFAVSLLVLSSCKQKPKEAEAEKKTASVPAIDDVVMYEIFVRNFTPEGTFNAIIPQLDRLKKLGVNVLWLMPIQPTGVVNKKGTYGSPYAVQNFTEVNPSYGTKSDFRNLVDSVHAKGMYIIIDEVANHTAWDNPMVKAHPDWYTQDSTGKIIVPKGTDWNDVADLNYDNAGLIQQRISDLKYWIDSFNIDGYRCDAAHMVPDTFWKQVIPVLRQSRPLIMLAESDDTVMYSLGFDMTYGWKAYQALKKIWKGDSTVASLQRCLEYEATKYPANYRALRFITNHDETSWDDVPEVKFTNRDGAKAAFITMITLPGTPLLYNGQEVGYPTKINLFEKYSIDYSANPELQQWYTTVVNFYDQNNVLKKGTLDEFDTENSSVLIYERQLLGKDPLWIIVNTKNEENTAKLPKSLQNKMMKDQLSKEGIATVSEIKLRPYEYHIVVAE